MPVPLFFESKAKKEREEKRKEPLLWKKGRTSSSSSSSFFPLGKGRTCEIFTMMIKVCNLFRECLFHWQTVVAIAYLTHAEINVTFRFRPAIFTPMLRIPSCKHRKSYAVPLCTTSHAHNSPSRFTGQSEFRATLSNSPISRKKKKERK